MSALRQRLLPGHMSDGARARGYAADKRAQRLLGTARAMPRRRQHMPFAAHAPRVKIIILAPNMYARHAKCARHVAAAQPPSGSYAAGRLLPRLKSATKKMILRCAGMMFWHEAICRTRRRFAAPLSYMSILYHEV